MFSITCDPTAAALYLLLRPNRIKIEKTVPLGYGINVDLDKEGQIVGIEIINNAVLGVEIINDLAKTTKRINRTK